MFRSEYGKLPWQPWFIYVWDNQQSGLSFLMKSIIEASGPRRIGSVPASIARFPPSRIPISWTWGTWRGCGYTVHERPPLVRTLAQITSREKCLHLCMEANNRLSMDNIRYNYIGCVASDKTIWITGAFRVPYEPWQAGLKISGLMKFVPHFLPTSRIIPANSCPSIVGLILMSFGIRLWSTPWMEAYRMTCRCCLRLSSQEFHFPLWVEVQIPRGVNLSSINPDCFGLHIFR